MLFRTRKDHPDYYLYLNDSDHRTEAYINAHLGTSMCGVSFEFGGDEHDFNASLRIPYLVGFYTGIRHPLVKLVAEMVRDRLPSDLSPKYGSTNFEVTIHNWALWWDLGVDPMGWTNKRPKWRDGSWHPLGHHCVQSEKVLSESSIIVIMPEDNYHGKIKIEEITVGWDKLPRYFDATLLRANVTMNEDEHIPHPGKGENSWDCDEDGLFGSSRPIPSYVRRQDIPAFIALDIAADQQKLRQRRGGRDWKPQFTKAERKERRLKAIEERKNNPPEEPAVAVSNE